MNYIDKVLKNLNLYEVRFVPTRKTDGFYNVIYANENGLQISEGYPRNGYCRESLISKIGLDEFEKRKSG